jgi:AAA+ ATPase superfamily predicted ATPase
MKDFKFGGPIEPELFYNREKEIHFLSEKLSQIAKGIEHNYALVGPRRIGKSSMLYILKEKLAKNKITPVFIDCEGREVAKQAELSLELLLELWGNSVLDTCFKKFNLTDKIKIRLSDFVLVAKDKAIAALSEMLGKTRVLEFKAAQEYLSFRIEFEKATLIEKPKYSELVKLFEDTMNLPEKIGKEKNIYFVLMLDEFQNLGNFREPIDFLSAFRRHMQAQRRVAYLFTGSNVGMMENILLRKPFGGHIPVEWVGAFSYDVAKNFLSQRFKQLGRRIDEEVVHEIVDFTQGHPAYLNWFGEQCCREVGKNQSVQHALVKKLEEKIFEIDGLGHVFSEELNKVSAKKGKIFQTFIEMNAHDLEGPSQISKQIQRSTPTEIITYLKRLEQRGFVRHIGKGKYVVVDKMLQNYVKKKVHVI